MNGLHTWKQRTFVKRQKGFRHSNYELKSIKYSRKKKKCNLSENESELSNSIFVECIYSVLKSVTIPKYSVVAMMRTWRETYPVLSVDMIHDE